MNRIAGQGTPRAKQRRGTQSRFDINGRGILRHPRVGPELVPPASTIADRLLEGDRAVAAKLATGLLKPRRDNLVERPWGGARLCEFKGLTGAPVRRRPHRSASRSSYRPTTATTRRGCIPSVLVLADGSTITLPALLAVHAETLLGDDFVQRYGRRFPLLPKLLDVAELLVGASASARQHRGLRHRRSRSRRDDSAWALPPTSMPPRGLPKLAGGPPRSTALARAVRRGLRGRAASRVEALARAARRDTGELEAALRPRLEDGGVGPRSTPCSSRCIASTGARSTR